MSTHIEGISSRTQYSIFSFLHIDNFCTQIPGFWKEGMLMVGIGLIVWLRHHEPFLSWSDGNFSHWKAIWELSGSPDAHLGPALPSGLSEEGAYCLLSCFLCMWQASALAFGVLTSCYPVRPYETLEEKHGLCRIPMKFQCWLHLLGNFKYVVEKI